MLELMGSEYVIDHVIAEHEAHMHTEIYRSYTADMLKSIAENMGAEVVYRYADLIEPHTEEEETGDEIALKVIEKLGLRVNDGYFETESVIDA